MNRDDAFIRRMEDYLEAFEGVTPLPDRVRDAIHAELPRTRQVRHARGAWRFLDPSRGASTGPRPVLVATALVVVVVMGAALLNMGRVVPGVGSMAPTRSPSSSPTPAPPTPTPVPLPADGVFVTQPGSYEADDPFHVRVTFTIPVDWAGHVGGPYAVWLNSSLGNWEGASIDFTLAQTLYADPCNDRGLLEPQPGPTVEDLASALATLPGFDATTPSEVTIDGHTGKQLTLTAPERFRGCTLTEDGYRLWRLPLGPVVSFRPGQQTTFSILEVDGQRLVISSDTYPTTIPQARAEVQQILGSIRFAPPSQQP